MESFESNKPFKKFRSIEFQECAYVFWGVILLIMTSQLSIPLQPVPITLQSLGVMLIGLIYQRNHAILVVLIYLALGAMGAPGFANYHEGIQYLVGPSGGYLWGFLGAVIVMTTLTPYLNYRRFLHVAFSCIMGTLVIHIFGVGWLAHLIGLNEAIQAGFLPFILPSTIKILFLTVTFKFLRFGCG